MTAEAQEDRRPQYDGPAFECPYCGVYATQKWADVTWGIPRPGYNAGTQGKFYKGWKWSLCRHCDSVALWSHKEELVWPEQSRLGPEANPDMPANVKAIYEEARKVLAVSPRSAAALLRLALQTLIDTLEPGSKSINEKIRRLVARGLEPDARKAMDVLRVVGNNAVHPGEILVDGDQELVPALFVLLNLIVHHVLSRPRQVDSLFESLPESARQSIERRDGEGAKVTSITGSSRQAKKKAEQKGSGSTAERKEAGV